MIVNPHPSSCQSPLSNSAMPSLSSQTHYNALKHYIELYYTSHKILHKHWWFWMNCRKNMWFSEKCRTHQGIKYWMYRMPNRSLNKRKISDSPPFVGMRAGAAAGSWIEDYSLGIDSTILGTSNPPPRAALIFKQFLCHGNSIFFWTPPLICGGTPFRISNSFQIAQH